MTVAITRRVSPRFAECELTHIDRLPIDLDLARAQHAAYASTLAALGCDVVELPEEPNFPDSVFVEDTALVFSQFAVMTRPGAESRRGETPSVADALGPYRTLRAVVEPATLDGGDVLQVGRTVFVGRSSRTNGAAAEQLTAMLSGSSYVVRTVDVSGCLHLKSAVTAVDDRTVLINPRWVDTQAFSDYELIPVEPSEEFGANCLAVGGTIIYPAAFPLTRARLQAHGCNVLTVDVSELAKAEGAVSCCSLIIET